MAIIRRVLCLITVFIISFLFLSLLCIFDHDYSYAEESRSQNILKAQYYCDSEIFAPYTCVPDIGQLPYEVYMTEMENDDGFAEGFITWRVTNMAEGEDLFSQEGFYEAVLFDLFCNIERDESFDEQIDALVKATKIKNYKTMKSAWEKAFGKTGPDLASYYSRELTDEEMNDFKSALYDRGGTYYEVAFGTFEKFNSVLSDVKTALDMNHRISNILAVKEVSDNKRKILEKMLAEAESDDSYTELRIAIRKIKGYYDSDFNTAYIIAGEVTEWAANKLVEECLGKMWDDLTKGLGNGWLKLLYKSGKSAINAWFSTDKYYECYMEMYALKSIKGILRPLAIEARENFLDDPTEENAVMLNTFVDLMCGYEGMGYEYSINFLKMQDDEGVNYVLHAFGYQGTDGSPMIRDYEDMQELKTMYFECAEQLLGELSMQGQENYDDVYSEFFKLEDQKDFDAFCTVCNDVNKTLPGMKTNLGIQCGTASVTEPCSIGRGSFGTLSISDCELDFNGDVSTGWLLLSDSVLMTGGDLSVGAIRRMESDNDEIHVKGDLIVTGDNGGSLMKAGTIKLEGDMIFQLNYNGSYTGFKPQGTCKTVFCGNKLQTIKGDLTVSGCDIGLVELQNPLFTMDLRNDGNQDYSFPTLILASDSAEITNDGEIQAKMLDLNGHKLNTAGTVTVSSTLTSSGTSAVLSAKQVTAPCIDLSNCALTANSNVTSRELKLSDGQVNVSGDFIVEQIILSNGKVMIDGDLTTNVIRKMESENDLIHVKGDMTVNAQSYYSSSMTAGTVELEGDLIFNTTGENKHGYDPTGTCKTVFCGTELQTVRGQTYENKCNIRLIDIRNPLFTMDMTLDTYSHFYYPELIFTSNCSITYENGKLQASNMDLDGHKVMTEGDVEIRGNFTSSQKGGRLKAKSISADRIELTDSSLESDGDVYLSNHIILSDAQLTVGGDLRTRVIRKMESENDLIHVKGNMTVDAQSYYSCSMTAGTVELEGDLTINTTTDNRHGYEPAGTCKTVFCGSDKQTVNKEVSSVVNAHENEADLTYVSGNNTVYIHDPEYKTGDRYIQLATVSASADKYEFNENGLMPALEVKYGSIELNADDDYTVTPEEQTETSGTFLITGKNTYKGTRDIVLDNVDITICIRHDWGDYTVDKEPTCTENGSKSIHCSRCGAVKEGSEVVIPAAHKYGDLLSEVPASCEKDGLRARYECSACHKLFIKDNNQYIEKTSDELVVEKLGHDWGDYTVDKEPTCTENGSKSIHCSRCGVVKEGSEVVIPAAHKFGDLISEVPAACEKDGLRAHYKCSVCYKLFIKAEDKYIETTSDELVIKKLGHDYKKVAGTAVSATCETEGKKADLECSRCHAEITGAKIAALGHDWGEMTEVEPSTCIKKGQMVRICKRDPEHKEYKYTDLIDHKMTRFEAKEPTCTAPGNSEYWECSICNGIFSDKDGKTKITLDDTVVKATGHVWGEPVYTWSDNNSSVTATRYCSHNNSHTETETATAASEITKPATYKEMGQTTYTAVFTNTVFETQQKTETDIPVLSKKTNPFTVTAKTIKIKYSKIKNMNLKFKAKQVFSVKNKKGSISYKKKKKGDARISISSTGKITVKKGIKKGTYKLIVTVKAAGNEEYKSGTKTVTVKINIK